MDLQAMDRAHRIGQKKEVQVFRRVRTQPHSRFPPHPTSPHPQLTPSPLLPSHPHPHPPPQLHDGGQC